jgi:hypothetical protein
MSDYGLKIAKTGFDVATAEPKDLIFSSSFACLKILQLGKVSAVNAGNINFDAGVAFPLVIIVFLYDSAISKYEPIEAEYDTTKLYLPGGEAANSLYYYYICYA